MSLAVALVRMLVIEAILAALLGIDIIAASFWEGSSSNGGVSTRLFRCCSNLSCNRLGAPLEVPWATLGVTARSVNFVEV
eukprot:CAMPEP_0206613764 /NCGR_PEP_ID=MMETSP0325_2-20121206/56930_1 /ASSEMBLY_ACC=CAM_ASM_000347 /TAXON_ID=2866 /ORGANISM="Crypthecodinium cohnii, Strain Seligo" /LENGTH=79 /DNA_ID=CAMNT_0054134011 /DNA_START=164 /DNA_END=403 /DNA_ORIENTATION=-